MPWLERDENQVNIFIYCKRTKRRRVQYHIDYTW
jgi:hypothetical protein